MLCEYVNIIRSCAIGPSVGLCGTKQQGNAPEQCAQCPELGARSSELGARRSEHGALSPERGAQSPEPGARSPEPGARSRLMKGKFSILISLSIRNFKVLLDGRGEETEG